MYKVQNKIARTSSWSSYNFFLKSFHYRVKLKIQSCKNLFPSNQPLHCENIFPLTTPNISGIVLVLISWTFVQTEKRVELHKNKLLMFKKKVLPCPCKTMHMTMVLVLHFDSWTSEKELLTQIIAILLIFEYQ